MTPETLAAKMLTENGMTPFHDLHAVVSGDVARVLGMRFRERWQKSSGEILPIPPDDGPTQWPPDLIPESTATAASR